MTISIERVDSKTGCLRRIQKTLRIDIHPSEPWLCSRPWSLTKAGNSAELTKWIRAVVSLFLTIYLAIYCSSTTVEG